MLNAISNIQLSCNRSFTELFFMNYYKLKMLVGAREIALLVCFVSF